MTLLANMHGLFSPLIEISSTGQEIIQIAATDGNNLFNVYVKPKPPFSEWKSSGVHGLTVDEDGSLLRNGRPITGVKPIKDALIEFIDWLKTRKPCLLLAHNAKAFDGIWLIRAVEFNHLVVDFQEAVLGFSDTLRAFREGLPERKVYNLPTLVEDLLPGFSYDAHNAQEDVQALHKLTDTKFLNTELLVKHSFTVSWAMLNSAFLQQKAINRQTFQPLVWDKVISKGISDKAAASGLTFHHLALAFQRSGVSGLQNILKEKVDGKPRVTNFTRILSQIAEYFESLEN